MRPLAAMALLAACSGGPKPDDPGRHAVALDALGEAYWEFQLQSNPRWATTLGDPRFNDRLESIGPESRRRTTEALSAFLEKLGTIDREALDESRRASRDLLKLGMEGTLEELRHKFYQWDVDQMDGPAVWLPRMLETFPLKQPGDYRNLIRRYEAFPGWIAEYLANLREGLAEGRVASRMAVERVAGQLETILGTPIDRSPLLPAAGPRLELTIALSDHVMPAYRKLLLFLRQDYLPKARAENVGLSALPGGAEAYAHRIRHHTTLPLSAEEVHRIGLEELAAVHAEMQQIATRVSFPGDVPAFIRVVREDPAMYAASGQELLEGFREILRRVDAKLPEVFGSLPKTPYVVEPMPPYQEKDAPSAYYELPSPDGARPGIFKANTYMPGSRPRYTMAALAVHEAVPGHHLQIALAQEQKGLPPFRREGHVTAFVEGWALYTERLADEMGIYRDDMERFGMLTYQAWRAARLVVDTGIHAQGWSREKALEFIRLNVGLSEREAANEIDRYIIWPGQALAYMIGQRHILKLRAAARRQLGDRFDLKQFHDRVLLNGAIPLEALEDNIKRWMAAPP